MVDIIPWSRFKVNTTFYIFWDVKAMLHQNLVSLFIFYSVHTLWYVTWTKNTALVISKIKVVFSKEKNDLILEWIKLLSFSMRIDFRLHVEIRRFAAWTCIAQNGYRKWSYQTQVKSVKIYVNIYVIILHSTRNNRSSYDSINLKTLRNIRRKIQRASKNRCTSIFNLIQ